MMRASHNSVTPAKAGAPLCYGKKLDSGLRRNDECLEGTSA